MAKSKIISYDLCTPGKNYDDLYKYLKGYQVWAHITESTWFISTDKSCQEIRDEIKDIVDSNDVIFVGELNGVAAWRNVLCNSDYLKNNL